MEDLEVVIKQNEGNEELKESEDWKAAMAAMAEGAPFKEPIEE